MFGPAKTGTALAKLPPGLIKPAREEPPPGGFGFPGWRALDAIRGYLGHWCYWRSDAELDRVTLWYGHAAARDEAGQLIWFSTPRLLLVAEDRESGKSTAEDLICLLDGTKRLTRCTPAHLADKIREGHIAALDEGQLVFGTGAKSVQLQTDLNGGYTRLGAAGIAKSELSTFGPVVIAGKTDMLHTGADSLNDLVSRAIIVHMDPSPIAIPPIGRDTMSWGGKIGGVMAKWTELNRHALEDAEEQLGRQWAATIGRIDKGVARRKQIARPLEAVALLAGGDWPERYEAAFAQTRPVELDVLDEVEALAASWMS